MTGYSTQKPDLIIPYGGGYQFRYNLREETTETENGPVTQWAYEYLNTQEDPERYAKTVRNAQLLNLKITTAAGHEFDADEVSQNRMARAIQTAEIAGLTETQWTIADNSSPLIPLAELREALSLSMMAQAALWFE
jgi:hypothetical protein